MNHKIFISYSWSNPKHEEWVLYLAQRLRSDGVNVVLDKWDLKEGQDKYTFMESMVNSDDIIKVLMILDKKYQIKADERAGGVGTETQIISPKLYENLSQEKFIPIISEKDENGQPFLPAYLKGRMYIDLSNESYYEKSYEDLLRNIYNKPRYRKPELGRPPGYLFEAAPNNSKSSSLIRRLNYVIENKPEKTNKTIKEFLTNFLTSLSDYTIDFDTRDSIEIGKLIVDNINLYTELRDDYIAFMKTLLSEEIEFEAELFIEFFEKLPAFEDPREGVRSYTNYTYDNFKIFTYELFLFSIALGFNTKNYSFIKFLIESSYFIESRDNYNSDVSDFTVFYRKVNSINSYYNETFNKKFHNPMADLIMTRLPQGLYEKDIVIGDLICLHHAILNDQFWFPQTYIYYNNYKIPLFQKLGSQRHFERIKHIFCVDNKEDLIIQLNTVKENAGDNAFRRYSYNGVFDSAPLMYQLIDNETLCTKA